MDLLRKDLERLASQYSQNISIYKNDKIYNEQACRDEFISPLLECFGWDVKNKKGISPQYKEVIVEKFSTKNERPDYTLTLNGLSKIFVEAKKPSVNILTENKPAYQARSYGWNAGHRISVLTNFENLIIYDTTYKPDSCDNVNVCIYKKYHYSEYVEKFNEIYKILSKENMYNGYFDEFISANFTNDDRTKSVIDDLFLQQLNCWRFTLGLSLYNNNEEYRNNIQVLNDDVQEFINQIIFLRICEDRSLPLYKNLKNVAETKEELKTALQKLIKEADKRYNSKLFSNNKIIFDMDNDIIFNMIYCLYYPYSPYMFDIIEPRILGKIYEAFLTQRLELKDGELILGNKNEYKNRSIVTTPIEIVKYMVKNTLQELCKGKNPKEILNLKIADIACGSGIFLEEAFQYLSNYCIDWYLENNPKHLIELPNGRKTLPYNEKKEILTNCIYGIDIDYHAAEVCKFSLLIKLIEDETEATVFESKPILPNLHRNIQNGNSLISRTDLPTNLSIDELQLIKPFDWDNINNNKKFDAILGNPPYVNTEDIHKLESELEFNIYKKKFISAYKQFDKYYLFLEEALSQINSTGKVCYIIPNKFYKIDSGTELRNLLKSNIEKIDNFGSIQLFPDKTIYSCIVTLSKKVTDFFDFFEISSPIKLWAGLEHNFISINNSTLSKNIWQLTTDKKILTILEKLEKSNFVLADVADIFNGIQTSAERPPVYWFSKDEVISENEKYVFIHKFNSNYKIEKELLRPYFKPTSKDEKGQETYSTLKTDKCIIFPYNSDGKLIDINVMKSKYSETYKYLLDQYSYLEPKCLNKNKKGRDIKNADKNTWYQYGRSQALTSFINTPKLIVKVLSKNPMYSYDDKDMLIASGGTAGYCAISKKQNSEYNLFFIQAWLSHPYTEKIIRILGSDFEGDYVARGTYLLQKLPIAKLNFRNLNEKKIYDEIINLSKNIQKICDLLTKRNSKSEKNVLQTEKKQLIKKIEDYITKIYESII